MAWFWFPGAVSGPDVQSHNFKIEGGNVQDPMDSPELCRKLNFLVPRQAGRDQFFWVATELGRQAGHTHNTHNTLGGAERHDTLAHNQDPGGARPHPGCGSTVATKAHYSKKKKQSFFF